MFQAIRRFQMTLLLVLVFAVANSTLQAASPSLGIIMPRGVQRGTEAVLTFQGDRLADAEEILFYSGKFEVVKVEPADKAVTVTLKIAEDCRLGQHIAQVRTRSGLSEFQSFSVGALPISDEAEPNSEFETPQKIEINSTIHGIIQNEDVDYFAVDAKKGDRISVEIEAMRLGSAMIDPYVAILDSKRFEMAAADDSTLVNQDGVASVIAPDDGTYYIEVRESAYGGNGDSRYCLHVGSFPRPTAVYPAGGQLGQELDVTFIGDPTGDVAAHFALPSEVINEYGLFAQDDKGIAPSANVFRLCDFGNSMEVEPNASLEQATPAELPNAFNGIIGEPGDVDFFKFTATKGQVFDIECFARRVRSNLDPVMHLYDAAGTNVASNDDSRGPDSYFRYTIPADGEYKIRVTDHLNAGGPDFVYRIEFLPVKPTLTLGIPRVGRYSQYQQAVYVPRGNRFGTLISATRGNFGGELVVDPQNVPPGINIIADPMAANLNLMPVVFEAAADAPLGGALVDFTARHIDEALNIRGGYENKADFVHGPPNNAVYIYGDVNRLAMAVVEEIPFKLEIEQSKVPLVRNGVKQLKVIAHRKEGFDEPINVQFPFRPPGVGAPTSVNIPKGQSEVLYQLDANANAQVGSWKVFALGSANVNGTAWSSSQLAVLDIAEPMVQFTVERSSVEQGKETELFCKIQHNAPFEGTAKAEVLGLPAMVTTTVLDFTKETPELAFKITTDPTSPAGNHKTVFCRVIIERDGEQIIHQNVGGNELRIDVPLPPKKDAPPAQPMPKAEEKKPEPMPVPEKRLTRLEKLRLEAKERAEGK